MCMTIGKSRRKGKSTMLYIQGEIQNQGEIDHLSSLTTHQHSFKTSHTTKSKNISPRTYGQHNLPPREVRKLPTTTYNRISPLAHHPNHPDRKNLAFPSLHHNHVPFSAVPPGPNNRLDVLAHRGFHFLPPPVILRSVHVRDDLNLRLLDLAP